MINKENKKPLKIYVVWDNQFKEGVDYANQVYTLLCRNVDNPTERGIGISIDYINDYNFNFNKKDSNLNIVFMLIDDYLIANKENWSIFMSGIDQSEKNVLIPFAFDCKPFDFFENLYNRNVITLPISNKVEYFQFAISYEVTRGLNYLINDTKDIKLFLSYNNSTGNNTVEKVRGEILRSTKLNTFYDKHDIPFGGKIDLTIQKNIKESMVIVFLTDGFSSRDWCKKEIIEAKTNGRPMILLDFYEEGEIRLFPYLGNVRVIKLNPENIRYYKLLTAILLENIKMMYYSLHSEYLISLLNIESKNYVIMNQPPELLTVLDNDKSGKITYIYPEPPITNDEWNILSKVTNKDFYATPIMFSSAIAKDKNLCDSLNLGLSISYSQDYSKIDVLKIQDVITTIIKYLFALNFSIYYAGDPNYNENLSFSDILLNVKDKSKISISSNKNLFLILTKEIYNTINIKQLNFIKKFSEIVKVNSNFEDSSKTELSNAREMLSKKIDAHIILGGKFENYQGILPGILEELIYSLKQNNRIFILGGFGGAAGIICDVISNKENIDRTKEFDSISEVKYEDLNNGLSYDENLILMYSKDTDVIMSLILKGIKKKF